MTVLGRILGRKGEHAAGAAHLLHGADVSSYQGEPGTWRPRVGSIDFVATKFTELRAGNSRYVNPYARDDFAWCKEHGKGRIAYLFGHPAAPAADTVGYFASEVTAAGLDDGDAVALDHEVSDGLSPAHASDWAQDVTSRLEKEFGRKPLVYCDRSFALDGYCAGLGHLPLWLADISVPAGQPRVPKPWKSYAIHQFSWTPLDRDVAPFASLADMRAALGKPKKQEAVILTADGKTTLHDLVTPHKVSCMHALRLTLEHFGHWHDDLYRWGNDVLRDRKPPKGTQIVVKKAG